MKICSPRYYKKSYGASSFIDSDYQPNCSPDTLIQFLPYIALDDHIIVDCSIMVLLSDHVATEKSQFCMLCTMPAAWNNLWILITKSDCALDE